MSTRMASSVGSPNCPPLPQRSQSLLPGRAVSSAAMRSSASGHKPAADPRAAPFRADDPGFTQDLQVMADGGLGEVEHGGQPADAHFAPCHARHERGERAGAPPRVTSCHCRGRLPAVSQGEWVQWQPGARALPPPGQRGGARCRAAVHCAVWCWSVVVVPGFEAFFDGERGDDERGDGVGLPPAEGGVQPDAGQGSGGPARGGPLAAGRRTDAQRHVLP